MGSTRPDRRGFLKGGAALAGGLTLGATEPAFGQLQRGVDAGKAATNDADIGLLLALQNRQPELLVSGGGVVRRGVLVSMG